MFIVCLSLLKQRLREDKKLYIFLDQILFNEELLNG